MLYSAAYRSSSRAAYSPLPSVWAFAAGATTIPAADFCRTVGADCSTLSSDSGTCDRPSEVSSTAFNAQPPNLQPAPLMDMDFAIICPLVRRRMSHIRFLSIGSRLGPRCFQTPPHDDALVLSLLLHQDVKGTRTPKLLNMLGTQKRRYEYSRSALYCSISITIINTALYSWQQGTAKDSKFLFHPQIAGRCAYTYGAFAIGSNPLAAGCGPIL